jgi:hypothetical protein
VAGFLARMPVLKVAMALLKSLWPKMEIAHFLWAISLVDRDWLRSAEMRADVIGHRLVQRPWGQARYWSSHATTTPFWCHL